MVAVRKNKQRDSQRRGRQMNAVRENKNRQRTRQTDR